VCGSRPCFSRFDGSWCQQFLQGQADREHSQANDIGDDIRVDQQHCGRKEKRPLEPRCDTQEVAFKAGRERDSANTAGAPPCEASERLSRRSAAIFFANRRSASKMEFRFL
jgi:hypothetical protein